ncbi:M15 family metallopeptidase [Streptomyces sp. G45]|uniref:M15 family metallopeptidase n=1 Tax=Streptomyces sp. G45 TaxID=3406627 RepID=UPI003C1EA825
MTRIPPAAHTATRRTRRLLVGALTAAVVIIAAVVGYRMLKPSPSSAEVPSKAPPAPSPYADRGERRVSPGAAEGVVPEGTKVLDDTQALDDTVPALANLDPRLRAALREAASDAAADGVTLTLNSGWRSPKYQNRLLREAISTYGSPEAAARWVATADTSPHVAGDAVDIGGDGAAAWLSRHGAAHGLCRIYRNEPWHYELRPHASEQGCPRPYANPTQDPRMQR